MLRKILWKFVADKIKIITCPTQDLKISLDQLKIFNKEKLFYLPDAIISIKDLKREKIFQFPMKFQKIKK